MEQLGRSIGPSVVIRGEVSAAEDLIVEGRVEGMIDLREAQLTIGPQGQVEAHVYAGDVVVVGELCGTVVARGRVDVRAEGRLRGDVTARNLKIAEGAYLQGRVTMGTEPERDPARAAVEQVTQLLGATS